MVGLYIVVCVKNLPNIFMFFVWEKVCILCNEADPNFPDEMQRKKFKSQ